MFKFNVPRGMLLKHLKMGYPSKTGIISIVVAPAEITIPEYRPVRYKGVTQLSASSIFSTFNFLNIILAITSRMRRSVNTFSRMITVFPKHEQLI